MTDALAPLLAAVWALASKFRDDSISRLEDKRIDELETAVRREAELLRLAEHQRTCVTCRVTGSIHIECSRGLELQQAIASEEAQK